MKLKILYSAYACSPEKGSEPGIGWNVSKRMAQNHEVWVVTCKRNQKDIENYLVKHSIPNLHFVYFDIPLLSLGVSPHRLYNQMYYYLWHLLLYGVVSSLHRKHQFDLIHHITWGRYWMPNSLSFLPIPFIWGPVAGGESAPKTFEKDFSLTGLFHERMRKVFRWLGEHDPFVRTTAKRSVAVLASTQMTLEGIKRIGAGHGILFSPQVGITRDEVAHLGRLQLPPVGSPFRLISIGRLVYWKGVHLSLKAFALSGVENSELWIIGDGPERENLVNLATQLGVIDRVKFVGWLPRAEAWSELEKCHIFLHPCLRNLVTTAYLEAMAARRPVISIDAHSNSEHPCSHEMGLRVAGQSPAILVEQFAEAIQALSKNEALCLSLGEAEREYVEQKFIWDQKVTRFESVYANAIQARKGESIQCDSASSSCASTERV